MHQKAWSYDLLFLRYGAWRTLMLFFILGNFLPFCPSNSPKNKNFKKMKKAPGYIIILHRCTTNHDHVLYYSWDMARDTCNCYFSFWAIFCPFTPLTAKKNQNMILIDMIWYLRCGARPDARTDGQTDG